MSRIHEVRKRKLKKATDKKCPDCGRVLPLTAEYWRRNSATKNGFEFRCKECSGKAIQAHYVRFTKEDVANKGKAGVFCPLYAKKCQVCNEGAAGCWRLEDYDDDPDGYPEVLFEDD